MEISQMRYFVDICKSGSLSRAAESLHMSQQGLSIAIRRLESELNCDLFYRKSSGLVLTDYGKMFKSEAEAVLKHIDNIYEYCSTGCHNTIKLNVACTMNIIVHLPVKLQQLLVNGTDEINVNCVEDWTRNCETRVLEDEAALGIVYGDCEETKFDVTTLDTLRQVFIVNKESPLAQQDTITIKDLDNVPLVLPHASCRPGRVLRKMFENSGTQLNIALDCDRPHQTISLIKNNPKLAARIIYEDITEEDLDKVKILRLKDNPFLLPICLIKKKGHQLSMHERYFTHMIIDSFRKDEN